MPELAEVESSCKLIRDHCVGKRIVKVTSKEQGGGPRDGQFDDLIFSEDITENDVQAAFQGAKLISVGRKGKQMWFELDGEKKKAKKKMFVLVHLGMTGSLTVKDIKGTTYKSFKVAKSWPPRFCKLELTMASDDGEEIKLGFTDPRRLGRIRLRIDDPFTKPPLSILGSDPVLGPLSVDEFETAVLRSNAPIKGLLLNQNGPFCGIGNWIADEVLYQSEIHPAAKGSTLVNSQIKSLYDSIIGVCKFAVDVDANYKKFPSDWLFHQRWSKGKKKTAKINGKTITFLTVAGRTSAVVTSVQRMGQRKSVQAKRSLSTGRSKSSTNTVLKGNAEPKKKDTALKVESKRRKVRHSSSTAASLLNDPGKLPAGMRITRAMLKALQRI